jgi:Raf kinase inhibitor-like YbhB/YbcL family protein
MNRIALGLLAACNSGGSGSIDAPPGNLEASIDTPPGVFALSSPMLANNAMFPAANTCDGADTSPELDWVNPPAGVGSFAVVLYDRSLTPNLIHWVLYDIPGSATGLPTGVGMGYEPANIAGAHQPIGLQNQRQYHGPCPPALHVYDFIVYALPEPMLPGATMDTTKEDAEASITAHQGVMATLTGTYMH